MTIAEIISNKAQAGKELSIREAIEEIKENLIESIDEFDKSNGPYSGHIKVGQELFTEALTLGGLRDCYILSDAISSIASGAENLYHLLCELRDKSSFATAQDVDNIGSYLGYIYKNAGHDFKLDDAMDDLKEGFQEIFENEVALKKLAVNKKAEIVR